MTENGILRIGEYPSLGTQPYFFPLRNVFNEPEWEFVSGQPDDFEVYDTLGNIDAQDEVLQTLTLVLSLIAGISLIVGSIGLMNIMLVGVTERTAEIGLRRAMGARRGDILKQFLWEAILLALLGGLIGLARALLSV